jgi:hypothetical protein
MGATVLRFPIAESRRKALVRSRTAIRELTDSRDQDEDRGAEALEICVGLRDAESDSERDTWILRATNLADDAGL